MMSNHHVARGPQGRRAFGLLGFFASGLLFANPAKADITSYQAEPPLDLSRATAVSVRDEVGSDPAALFSFVRDKIRSDAYAGVLRGARGTLLSQAGNSLDKSILLRDLLDGIKECRFAHGTLDGKRVQELRQLAAAARATEPDAEADADATAAIDQILADTKRNYSLIVDSLTASGFAMPSGPSSASAAIDVELSDHYWLQCREGEGWTDFDASFASSSPGQAFATAAETSATLPASLFHKVTFTISLEHRKGDAAAEEKKLLTFEAPAADLSGMALFLTHRLENWEKPADLAGLSSALTAILDILGGSGTPTKIKPVLLVGGNYLVGEAFDTAEPGSSGGGIGGIGGIADAIDGPEAALGEWIDITFTAPDGTVESVRRQIFDRVGYAARKQGSTDVTWALGEDDPLARVFCLSIFGGPLRDQKALNPAPEVTVLVEAMAGDPMIYVDMGPVLEGLNLAIEMVSAHLGDAMQVDQDPFLFSATSPRLIISDVRVLSDSMKLSVDLARRAPRALGRTANAGTSDFRVAVLNGVFNTAVEDSIFDLFLATSAEGSELARPASYSAIELFKAASEKGMGVKVLSGADAAAAYGSGEAAFRMREALAAGHLLIAPDGPVQLGEQQRLAWWNVDPSSGQTVDVAENGLHQEQVEYVIIVNNPNNLGASGSITTLVLQPNGVYAPTAYSLWFNSWPKIIHILSRAVVIGL